ncbi:hypothetical protein TRFO_27067 [Tritrichomonas foetus]|uniref:DUF3447 domain-containing protein n=1 Tax=Tritrichomonas foetus TaxID=1144522 RepID=A0A1J4K6C5_9EUKA|nr:hypothetical protein TRFO_27067 [Tritrichomonas foetus]|eukprot:OHT05252.1 hypothetical protein TRFO_27067 [Tritrichomonas foetus]
MKPFYFGYLQPLDYLYDLKVVFNEIEIICPRVSAVKIIPKIKSLYEANEDLEGLELVNFDDFSLQNEEEVKLVTNILAEKPIWITDSNVEFLTRLADFLEISELKVTIETYNKCKQPISQQYESQFIKDNGKDALHVAASSCDAQLVLALIETKKFDINRKIGADGVFYEY